MTKAANKNFEIHLDAEEVEVWNDQVELAILAQHTERAAATLVNAVGKDKPEARRHYTKAMRQLLQYLESHNCSQGRI